MTKCVSSQAGSLESSFCLTWQLGCLDGVPQGDSRLLTSKGSNSWDSSKSSTSTWGLGLDSCSSGNAREHPYTWEPSSCAREHSTRVDTWEPHTWYFPWLRASSNSCSELRYHCTCRHS